MATEPRPWPNNAAEDRDQAAERLQSVLKEARRLRDVVREGKMTRFELAHIAGNIIDDAQTALRHLERQGAQTRPQ